MRFVLGLLIIAVSFTTHASASELRAMQTYLNETDFVKQIPARFPKGEAKEATQVEIPAAYQEIFDKVQEAAFGSKKLIQLRARADGNASADLESRSVLINVPFMNHFLYNSNLWEPRTGVAFILAHELSHFIQELSVSEKTGKDVVGLPSLMKLNLDRPGVVLQDFAPYFSIHAEVDIYALMILRKAGYRKPVEAIQSLHMLRSRHMVSGTDINNRIRLGQPVADFLWSAPLK